MNGNLHDKLVMIKAAFFNAIYRALVKRKGRVYLGTRVQFLKLPIIQMDKQSELHLADRVVLRSDNHDYHVNMFGRMKIFIENDGQVHIGERTRIVGTCIHARKEVRIGKRCLIAANCQIIDSSGHDLSFRNVSDRINTRGTSRRVVIEDDVWLSTGVVVLPGATIGRGTVIGANSVVQKDVPPFVVAAGNPLQIIKKLPKDDETAAI